MQCNRAQRTNSIFTHTIRFRFRIAVQAVVLVMLYGCAALSELPVSETPGPDEPDTSEPYSYTRAIELLLQGRAGSAETMLRTRLEAAPEDSRARELLRQIETPPAEYLGEDSFEYEVQPGESLSVLAQRFLGNYRLFYILARYNDIDKPSLVPAGQVLRIPSDYWDGPTPSREPLDREIRAREYLADGRPREALAMYEDAEPDSLGRDELALLGTAHQRWIEHALKRGAVDDARQRLDAARSQAPGNDSWEDWLGDLASRTTAEAAYRDGLSLRDSDPVAAAQALKRALEANPGDSRARNMLSDLRRQTVPELHREVVILYRNQELERAISLWEQVLTIDPEFQPAQGYLARAEELRRRLEDLD